MVDLFTRSHADFPFSFRKVAATSPYYLACAVEADFTADEFRFLFGSPGYGSSVAYMLQPNCARWILRDSVRGEYIVVVIYHNELHPTVFASSISGFQAFADYIEEGLEFVRGRQGYGC